MIKSIYKVYKNRRILNHLSTECMKSLRIVFYTIKTMKDMII